VSETDLYNKCKKSQLKYNYVLKTLAKWKVEQITTLEFKLSNYIAMISKWNVEQITTLEFKLYNYIAMIST
jgi:hypothetical protein